MKIPTIGKMIPDLKIDGHEALYPVINERETRAVAGIMFLIGIITFFVVFFTRNYVYINIVVIIFFFEFLLKVTIGPEKTPFGIIGGFAVSNQRPEWVGAVQKQFAWTLGLLMATTMIILTYGFGIRGWLPMSICITCLSLMWLESAFGICVGCKIYYGLIKMGVLPEPKVRPACPGGVCAIKSTKDA